MSVVVSRVKLVSVLTIATLAPGTTAPCASIDRPDEAAVEQLRRGWRGAEKTESEADTQNAET